MNRLLLSQGVCLCATFDPTEQQQSFKLCSQKMIPLVDTDFPFDPFAFPFHPFGTSAHPSPIKKPTLLKSGGGFFPRHRLDRHHTAFLVMDRLVFLLRSLHTQQHNTMLITATTIIQYHVTPSPTTPINQKLVHFIPQYNQNQQLSSELHIEKDFYQQFVIFYISLLSCPLFLVIKLFLYPIK